jgi:hypothetical protein
MEATVRDFDEALAAAGLGAKDAAAVTEFVKRFRASHAVEARVKMEAGLA